MAALWSIVPLSALVGYFLGALPVGMLVCRLYGVDVRTIGSGRTGTTNVWRAAGLKAAVPTLVGDAIKGVVAIWVIQQLYRWLFPETGPMSVEEATLRYTLLKGAEATAGAAAILGHNWSVFLGFRGGAGGITSAATVMMLSPLVGSIVWLIGAFLLWWTRIAAIATFGVGISAFALFLVLYLNQSAPWPYVIYGIVSLVAVIVALEPNREKLRKGEERVITLW
ncbi:MAG: glycerol-3-phosphate acyltransferase [Caldilineaceae bacterium]|nr:glycerol-3-phosphate acyltransferase [Caldilineaceae bacterium]